MLRSPVRRAYASSVVGTPITLKPASTYMISPVMPRDRSLARKSAAPPTSSMSTLRRSGATSRDQFGRAVIWWVGNPRGATLERVFSGLFGPDAPTAGGTPLMTEDEAAGVLIAAYRADTHLASEDDAEDTDAALAALRRATEGLAVRAGNSGAEGQRQADDAQR